MKKTLKMAVSGALALTIVGGIAVSASAATQGSLVMYHNIQGGPTQSYDEIDIEKNKNDDSYYAECTYISNCEAVVNSRSTSLSRYVEFEETGTISFTASVPGTMISFYGQMYTTDVSKPSRANINIGN